MAESVGADADALGRVLRLPCGHGLFVAQDEKFVHLPASRLLRSDHPQTMLNFVRMFGLTSNWTIFGALEHSVRTGLPAADKVLERGFWGHFADHPEQRAIFNAAMTAKAQAHIPRIVAAYDFSPFSRIGDIGGGRGHLLRAVLDPAQQAQGVLFDLPQVVQESPGGLSERLSLQGGDFFKDARPECDAYLLMEVIHDWGDEESISNLQAVRSAARPRAKLLLIEQIVPDDALPHWTKMLDLHMLAFFAARQRTRREYEAMLRRAGFSLEREIDTGADISILEAKVND